MPKSKSPGEGSIRITPANTYRGELMLGRKPDGSRNIFRCTCKTKEDVRRKFRDALRRYEQGEAVTSDKRTVAQFLAHWLEHVAKPSVFARTYHGYEELIRLHAMPALGHHKLARLSPAHIATLYSAKLETLSAQRVLHLHRVLHRAFETALRWGYLPFNPCSRVDPPKVPKRQQSAFTPEQAVIFYKALQGDPLEAFWLLALTTGMRSGELYALRWSDVDWQRGMLHVQRAYSRVSGVGRIEKGTKTDTGRAVPLIDVTLACLKRHKTRQIEAKLKAGPKWHERGLVFATAIGGPLQEEAVRQAFLSILDKAGLPAMRPYDLRHSAASIYLALGVSPKDVSSLLGHSTIRLTADLYGQSFESVQRATMSRFNDLLKTHSAFIPLEIEQPR